MAPTREIVDLQRQINELRNNLLDERERRIDDRQDFNLAVVLAIAAGIGGLWAKSRFQPARAGGTIGAAGTGRTASLPAGPTGEQRLRNEQAVADCTEAIRCEQDKVLHYLERGNALAELDRAEEAIADHDRALSLDPGSAVADLGRHDEAIEDFEEVVRLDADLAAGSDDE